MRTYDCDWDDKISAFFDGEGSAWERWLCGRHLRRCAACRLWLRETESGWHRLRAGLRGPVDLAFVDGVMTRVRSLSSPQPAAARATRPAPRWLAPVVQAAAAGAGVLALAAVVIPPLTHQRDSMLTSCETNLRHIGMALNVYAADYDDRMPPAGAWTAAVTAEPEGSRWLRCPGDTTRALWPSYGFEELLAGRRLESVPARASTPLVFEGRFNRFIPRHRRLGNVIFADLHMAAVHHLDLASAPGGPR